MITLDEPLASWILLIGRVCLALVFLVSGVHKMIWYQKSVAEFREAGVPFVGLVQPATVLLHLSASICLILGVYIPEASLALAAFTLVATVKVHCFWTMTGMQRLTISRVALANLAAIGGW